MDPTLQAVAAALLGVVVGAVGVYAFHLSERIQSVPEPTMKTAVPSGVAAVLSVLRSSAVVVDEHDRVLKASAPAYRLGVVRNDELVIADLADMVRHVRRDGQIREQQMTLEQELDAPLTLHARVAPLGSRLVLALLEDRTRETRVEAVRRDFVANVSHELKTPVGAIKILAEAVEDAAEDPEAVTRFAGRMRSEADRLSGLVHQVIELSRLQSIDPTDDRVPVDLDAVVADAVDASALDAESRGIELVAEGVPGIKVNADLELLTAAVTNLVANAVTYSDENSSVLVETRLDDRMVDICVVDRGIGIPSTEIDRIFERFYRVDPARHRSTGGSGLGLSIVKHVAATHGGDVKVWSAEGQGSTFTLSLPRIVEPDPTAHDTPHTHEDTQEEGHTA